MKQFFLALTIITILLAPALALVSASPATSAHFEICIVDDEAGVSFHIREVESGLAVLRVTGAPYYQDYPADGILFHDGSCLSWGKASYETQQQDGTITLDYTIDRCSQRASVKVVYLGQHFYYQDTNLLDSVCDGSPPTPNQPPVAEASAFPREGTAPLSVNFTAMASDPDGRIAGTHWNFGDGHASGDLNHTHTFTRPGTYRVKFTATDALGLEASTSLEIVVRAPDGTPPEDGEGGDDDDDEEPPVVNEPPAVSIDADRLTVKPKKKGVITFTARAEDADGQIASIAWNFGDGATASGSTVQHFWKKKGSYTVTCRVKDNDGAEANSSITITVKKK